MLIYLQKYFTQKKLTTLIVLMFIFIVFPTSFVFASNTSSPGILSDMLLMLMTPFHWLVEFAATLMGASMYYTVVRMGYYIKDIGSLQTAWALFRDLGNILLVFGFIAIGIATILDNVTYGAKKVLPKLLLVAILLNFSLFFTEFIVDTGNVFATQFYAQINGGSIPTSFNASPEPISNAVMTAVKTSSIYSTVNAKLPAGQKVEIALLGIIMFLILAFVFGAIAIMLISRFVVLLFLLIVSPIGFIGLAGIPLISSYGKKWWHVLASQTILAPVLLLFLLVVTKMAQSTFVSSITGGVNYGTAVSSPGTTSMSGLLLTFSVIIGLLIVSLIVAKSLSNKAAGFATKISGRATFGQVGWLGQKTIGWSGQRLSEKWRSSKIGRSAVFGRIGGDMLDRAAKSSFDVRATKIGGGLSALGIGAGKTKTGGYRGAEEEKIKKTEEYSKSLRPTKADKEETERMKEGVTILQDINTNEKEKFDNTIEKINEDSDAELKKIDTKIKEIEDSINSTFIKSPNDLAELKQDLQTLQTQKNDIINQQTKQTEDVNKQFTTEQTKREANVAKKTSEMKERESKNFPQILYAKNMRELSYGLGMYGSKWRKDVAKKIIKDATKDDKEKFVDTIEKILKESAKDKKDISEQDS